MLRKILLGLAIGLLALGGLVYAYLPPKPSPAAIHAAVEQSDARMEAAWRLPVAASYRPDFLWQSNGSRCGPASLANTFRSLGDRLRTEDEVLAGTGLCWSGYCIMGLTLDQLADVARMHTRRKVTVLRDLTEDAFREQLRHANEPDRRYIVNFTRKSIFGAGVGHFSPIGGYLEDKDMVLVLDVNRNYKPWLISRSRLYAAMNTMDGDKKRGLLLIQ